MESKRQGTSLVPIASPRAHSSKSLVRRGLDGLVALAASRERWEECCTLVGHEAPIAVLVTLPDGRSLLSADTDGAILLWSLDRRVLLRRVTEVGPMRAFAASHDAQLLAVGRAAGGITLHDFVTGARLGHLDATRIAWLDPATDSAGAARPSRYSIPSALAFSARGDTLLAAYGAQRVLEWDSDSRSLVCWLDTHGEPLWNIFAVTATPDGRSIIGGDGAGRIGSWSAGIGKTQWIRSGHAWPVLQLAPSPDGSCVASVAGDGSASVWNTSDGAPLAMAAGTGAGVTAAAFSSDSSRLVVAGRDGTVYVWARAPWREVARWHAQPSKIMTVAVADGMLICSAGEDHVIRIWERTA